MRLSLLLWVGIPSGKVGQYQLHNTVDEREGKK